MVFGGNRLGLATTSVRAAAVFFFYYHASHFTTVVLFTIFCILLLMSILRVLALKLSRLKADVVRVRADINNPCSAWGSMVRGAFRLRRNDRRNDKDRGRIRKNRLRTKCGQEGCHGMSEVCTVWSI